MCGVANGMILNKKTKLEGTRRERIIKALEMAGWFVGRQVDISVVEGYYQSKNVQLHQKALEFFREFYGLAENWYLGKDPNLSMGSHFEFVLIPHRYSRDDDLDVENWGDWSEYINVKKVAKEKVVLVGDIGYYYPASVWIGESGKIYATHDYDSEVYIFDSVVDLIEHELRMNDFDYVTITAYTTVITSQSQYEHNGQPRNGGNLCLENNFKEKPAWRLL